MKTFFVRWTGLQVVISAGGALAALALRPAQVSHAAANDSAVESFPHCGSSRPAESDIPWATSPLPLTLKVDDQNVGVLDARLLELKTQAGTIRCAEVLIKHPREDSLLLRDAQLPRTAQGSHLSIPLERLDQIEPLTLVHSDGKTTFGTIHLQAPASGGEAAMGRPLEKTLSFGLALAPISFSESQARENSYAALNLRLETEGEIALNTSRSMRIQGSADISAFILEEYGSDDLRSFRSSARFVYRLARIPERGTLSVGLGPHFQTMLVPTARFGFRNFAGPQASAHFEYGFPGGGSISAVTQVGLDGGFLSLPTLKTSEWATRFTYHTGTLAPGAQTAWPSEITYQFSSLAVSIHGIQMTGESHALGGRWNLF